MYLNLLRTDALGNPLHSFLKVVLQKQRRNWAVGMRWAIGSTHTSV